MQPWNCWHFLEFCLRLFFELMGGLKDSFIEIFEKNGYENKNQNSYLDIWQYYDDYIMSSLSSTAHFLNMLSFSCPFKQKILVKFGKRSFSADCQLSKKNNNILSAIYSAQSTLYLAEKNHWDSFLPSSLQVAALFWGVIFQYAISLLSRNLGRLSNTWNIYRPYWYALLLCQLMN